MPCAVCSTAREVKTVLARAPEPATMLGGADLPVAPARAGRVSDSDDSDDEDDETTSH